MESMQLASLHSAHIPQGAWAFKSRLGKGRLLLNHLCLLLGVPGILVP